MHLLRVSVYTLGGRELCGFDISHQEPVSTASLHFELSRCLGEQRLAEVFPYGFKLVAGVLLDDDEADIRALAMHDGEGRLRVAVTAVSKTLRKDHKLLLSYLQRALRSNLLTKPDAVEWHVKRAVLSSKGQGHRRPILSASSPLPLIRRQHLRPGFCLALATGLLLQRHYSWTMASDIIRIVFQEASGQHDGEAVELAASMLREHDGPAAGMLWRKVVLLHAALKYHNGADRQLLLLLAVWARRTLATALIPDLYEDVAHAGFPLDPEAGLRLLLKHLLPWNNKHNRGSSGGGWSAGALYVQAGQDDASEALAGLRRTVQEVCLEVVDRELPLKVAEGLVPLPSAWRLSSELDWQPRRRLRRKSEPPSLDAKTGKKRPRLV